MSCRMQRSWKKRHFLLSLNHYKYLSKSRIAKKFVNVMLFYCYGVFSKKKPVELNFIPSSPPYRLNKLETRTNGFAKRLKFGCLRASLGTNLWKPAPSCKLLCLEMEYKNAQYICSACKFRVPCIAYCK